MELLRTGTIISSDMGALLAPSPFGEALSWWR